MLDFMVRILGVGLAVGFGTGLVLKAWGLARGYRIDNGHGGLANDGDDWAPWPQPLSRTIRVATHRKPDPGEGWRLLEVGEAIVEGDEIEYGDGKWHEALLIGHAVHGAVVRRRIISTTEMIRRATRKRPDIEQQVCQDILDRQKLGIAKYGTTVAENPLSLREWLQHSYEEKLDDLIYMKRAIVAIDEDDHEKSPEPPKAIRNSIAEQIEGGGWPRED